MHLGDHAAGSHAVIEAHPALVVGILAAAQEILVSHEAGPLVDHPAAALHLDGVAAAEVGVQLRAVAAAFVRAPLEVLVLVEDDLQTGLAGVCARQFTQAGTDTTFPPERDREERERERERAALQSSRLLAALVTQKKWRNAKQSGSLNLPPAFSMK